ncbi:MAG: hypothetical protein KF718_07770 [Polyangiaceae bacterium]|nr:hypothetical protein [Polyangiaceae bacterium]
MIRSDAVAGRSFVQRARSSLRLLALVALVAVAVQTSRQTLRAFSVLEPHERCAERIAARYEPLRDYLPRHGIVGYIGPELTEDVCNAKFVLQYTLAPLLVSHVWERPHRLAARRTDFVVPDELPVVIVDTQDPEAVKWLEHNPQYAVLVRVAPELFIVGRTR